MYNDLSIYEIPLLKPPLNLRVFDRLFGHQQNWQPFSAFLGVSLAWRSKLDGGALLLNDFLDCLYEHRLEVR